MINNDKIITFGELQVPISELITLKVEKNGKFGIDYMVVGETEVFGYFQIANGSKEECEDIYRQIAPKFDNVT